MRFSKVAALGMGAAILVLGWYGLAPTQLGGRTAYVTTSGTSMEPLLHAGDLAIVRATDDYRVGDVVAYRNDELHAVVLHRIVSIQDGRYSFQGDNNTWVDDDRPTADALLGEMVWRVPGLGGHLRAVRTPLGLSTVTGVATFGVLGGRKRSRRGKERHEARTNGASRAATKTDPSRRQGRGGTGVLAAISGGIAVVAAIVAAISLALPTTVTTHREVAYDGSGTFSYSASAGEHGVAVYGRSALSTGDPVYLRLTDRVDVHFDYRLRTSGAFSGGGTTTLVAILSDDSGWTRSFVLAPVRPFDGAHAGVDGTLDLRQLRSIVADVEQLTGVERDAYRVAVVPEVTVDGTLSGVEIHRVFAPELAFQLDAFELQLPPALPGADGTIADPVHPIASDRVETTASVARSFAVLGIDLSLHAVRAGSLAVLALALLGAALALAMRRRASRRGEAALIASRYGQWLVPVHSSIVGGGRVVQVESFDSLRRLAEHYGHVVLHEEGDGFHAYSVEENGVTYRYRIANGAHA